MEQLIYIATTVIVVCFMYYSAHVLLEAYSKCNPGIINIGSPSVFRGDGVSITRYLMQNKVVSYFEQFPYAMLVLANNSLLTAKVDPSLYTQWRKEAIKELANEEAIKSSGIPIDVLTVLIQYVKTPGQYSVNDWLWFINGVVVTAIITERSLIAGGVIVGVFCAICWIGRWLFTGAPEVEYNRQLTNLALTQLRMNNQGVKNVVVGKDTA
jgi:hypothetical protein